MLVKNAAKRGDNNEKINIIYLIVVDDQYRYTGLGGGELSHRKCSAAEI